MNDREPRTAEHLLPMIYEGLVCLARNRMARYSAREYLNPSELVHEAYLRVVRGDQARFEGRGHLFFAISRAMRDLLVEGIRRNATGKRGGGFGNMELGSVEIAVEPRCREFLDLERALGKLGRHNPGCAQVVVLSYFVGLTHPEIARVLRLSRATVERRWESARAWLRRELVGGSVRGSNGENQLNG